MLKNILNLNGAKLLSRDEQKSINGGLVQACKMTSAWRINYSGGQAVSESCGWNCGGADFWAGCGI